MAAFESVPSKTERLDFWNNGPKFLQEVFQKSFYVDLLKN